MSEFDAIIGYEAVKQELMQVCDIIRNPEHYEKLGACMPRGVLLYGEPGLGKSLMAASLINESGLTCYTVRRTMGSSEFIRFITETFEEAKANSPAIVLLDDMDKFANEDQEHRNAEEYVAVQAGIDAVRDSRVFVIATVNDIYDLPNSLLRAGRFDKKIEVKRPTESDSDKIIRYYLAKKKLAEDVNLDDLAKMITYSSCAELETIMNEAAVLAGSRRKDSIEMVDIVEVVLRTQYSAPDMTTLQTEKSIQCSALHEAGHAVVCEALKKGSVGMVSIRTTWRSEIGGFTHRCKDLEWECDDIVVSLAGKAAMDLYHSMESSLGCGADIGRAYTHIWTRLTTEGTGGLGLIDRERWTSNYTAECVSTRIEAVAHAEMERAMMMAKDILQKNRATLEKVAAELAAKKTLLHSDIQRIFKEFPVTTAADFAI